MLLEVAAVIAVLYLTLITVFKKLDLPLLLRFVLKPAPVVLLALRTYTLAAEAEDSAGKTIAQYVAVGIFFGALGDIALLHETSKILFLVGLVLFLVQHLIAIWVCSTPRSQLCSHGSTCQNL
eukprot:m.341646 g.341646  ORF g.341646 m.341646 type:complete len:123 (-) comp55772_c0_seq4:2165-2533(-)